MRDFHYVSDVRWTQLRRDLEHCERTGKSPKTTLNNIAKVVDAGTMAETDEGCPAETACSECSKRQGVVCYAWRDPSKGRSCAYCKKQGISRCDAKQAEMRSEMERKVDAIAETVDLALAQLRVLTQGLIPADKAQRREWRRRNRLAKLPATVATMRARIERGGRESDSDEDSDFNDNQDPALTNGHDVDVTGSEQGANGGSSSYPALPNGNKPTSAYPGADAHRQTPTQQGRKRPRGNSSTTEANPRRRGPKNSRQDLDTGDAGMPAHIIAGLRSAAAETSSVTGSAPERSNKAADRDGIPPEQDVGASQRGPSSPNGTSTPNSNGTGNSSSSKNSNSNNNKNNSSNSNSNAEDFSGLDGLSRLASSAVAGFRPL